MALGDETILLLASGPRSLENVTTRMEIICNTGENHVSGPTHMIFTCSLCKCPAFLGVQSKLRMQVPARSPEATSNSEGSCNQESAVTIYSVHQNSLVNSIRQSGSQTLEVSNYVKRLP